ncbi:hypothetical protein WN944_007344 [Citrus x changshan-huyou]|uniref:Uncharacterized protein n=1 Tax=Citrus x changshan-huyou TaxID=2935761 RepID=A0AAP0QUS0_9ROSI
MEKSLLKLTFLVALIVTASCLGHGTEAREMTTNEAKPDSIECKKDDDCKQVCPDCKYKCNSPFCQCTCPPPPAATTKT